MRAELHGRSQAHRTYTSASPFISVVVPIRNEQAFIEGTLRALLHQDYPPGRYEVIVVDGRSTDQTLDIVRKMATIDSRIRIFDNPLHWSSAARNIGVREARGELIVIVDGHCDVELDYLSKMAAAFERTGADCLGRPQPLNIDSPTPTQEAIALARGSWLGHHPASYTFSSEELPVPAHSVAVAYRRNVFDKVGYFDESMDACEDVELNHRVDRAELTCYLIPELEVAYHPRRSLRDLFRQMNRYGRGRVRLLRKHPQTFSTLGFVPLWFLLFCLVGAVSLPLTPFLTHDAESARTAGFAATLVSWWPLAYAAVLTLYLITTLGTSLHLAARSGKWKLLLRTMFVFPAVHFGAAWGMLQELAGGPPRDRGQQGDSYPLSTTN